MTARFAVDEVPGPAVAGAGDVPVLRVRGEVDATNAASLESAVTARAAAVLVLDLTTVDYCDSAAFAALDRLLAGGRMAVVLPAGNPVHRAAAIMGLPLHESVDAATRALGG